MISEGITFHSLSATYCRIQCWRNSFVTGAKHGQNYLLLKFTNYSLWNCLATCYIIRLFFSCKLHSSEYYIRYALQEYNSNRHFEFVMKASRDFDRVLYLLILGSLQSTRLDNMYNFGKRINQALPSR